MAVLRVYWQTIKHFNLRGYQYIWANLAFVVLSLPIITIPAAWSALIHFSYLSQTSSQASLQDFWDAFKANSLRGAGIAVISAIVLLLNLVNLYSYRYETGLFVWLLRAVWIATLLLWFSLQMYLWPLFYEMKHPSLKGAFRNAFVMLLRHPFFTIGLWLGILIIAILSSILPVAWLLLTLSFFASLSTKAVLNCLHEAGYQKSKDFIPIEDRI
jgi:uncharacterized membrane protein YesL